MVRYLSLICCLLGTALLMGCANSMSPTPGPGIVVNIVNGLPNNAVQVGDPAITLKATVANDKSNSGVKWSLTVANVGCSPGCGTLVPSGSPSFSAVYTPPTTTPLNQQATIAAISVADGRQEFAITFTIIPPPSVTITNKFAAILNGGAPVEVDATVANDPAGAGVTWTLTAGGSACSPACGTLAPAAAPSFSAIYTPPAAYPGGANANPTITAASVTLPSATDSFAFTITNSASLFKGNYAFLLRGYDTNGNPMSVAGSVVSDGNNNLTGGELDYNIDGGITTIPSPQTGTYTVQLSPTGIAQVFFQITSYSFGSGTQHPMFRCTISADGTRGRIIELDASQFVNSGTIEQQNSSAIAAKPAGNFAFGVDSDAPFAGRTVAAGQLVLGAAGVTGGLIDQSVNAAASPTFVAATISPDVQSAPYALGRGTLTITVEGQSVQYAYYVVDSSHFLLLEIDHGTAFGTVFAGVARSQAALTAASVNGISVIQLTGFDEPSGTSNVVPVVIVGLLTVTGGNAYSLTFDINNIGVPLTQHGANGAVAFDPTTGRATLTAPDGFSSSFVNAGALYLYDNGKGFFIEEDVSTPDGTPPDQASTNLALSGTTLLQTGAPFTASNLSGNVIGGLGASSSPLIPSAEIGLNLASGNNYSAFGDLNSLSSEGGSQPGLQFSGKFQLSSLAAGYGRILLPTELFGDFTSPAGTNTTCSFYMIAPNQFVAISDKPGLPSGVVFVDPQ